MSESERRKLRQDIDEAVRALIAGKKWCERCWRWLPLDEYAAGVSSCRGCESRRVSDAYRRRKAAACR